MNISQAYNRKVGDLLAIPAKPVPHCHASPHWRQGNSSCFVAVAQQMRPLGSYTRSVPMWCRLDQWTWNKQHSSMKTLVTTCTLCKSRSTLTLGLWVSLPTEGSARHTTGMMAILQVYGGWLLITWMNWDAIWSRGWPQESPKLWDLCPFSLLFTWTESAKKYEPCD